MRAIMLGIVDGDGGVFLLDESNQDLVEVDNVPNAARELT
jgi:hypothetical protein